MSIPQFLKWIYESRPFQPANHLLPAKKETLHSMAVESITNEFECDYNLRLVL